MNETWKIRTKEKYPWLFFDPNAAWFRSLLFTLIGITLSILIFFLYIHSGNDPTPDSIAGYLYAITGTACMLTAAIGYTLKRLSRKRGVGELNGSLHWHVAFGVIALVLLCLHSFGNFNPRSGTYALYSLIALVLSGIGGRLLDRLLPRMIAMDVQRALTAQGDDRIEYHSRSIESLVSYNNDQLHSLAPEEQKVMAERSISLINQETLLPTSWDLAYISLEELPQELLQDERHLRFVPDPKSELSKPGGLMPGVQQHLVELQDVQRALGREVFYRALIRYWRVGHVVLMFTTLGLTLWHLEYATTLLLPVFFH